jgi:hypothetical protein
MVQDNCYQWRQGCETPYDAGEIVDSGSGVGTDGGGGTGSADASHGG